MINENKNKCFICDSNRKVDKKPIPVPVHPSGYYYKCEICGNVEIEDLTELGLDKKQKHLISGYTRERTYKELKPIYLTDDKIKEILESGDIPKTVPDKLDKIILYLSLKSKPISEYVPINHNTDYSIAYAENSNEFVYLLSYLRNSKLIESNQKSDVFNDARLTVSGWRMVYNLERFIKKSDQVFVAMWIPDTNHKDYSEMKRIYNEGIAKAIIKAGYKPLKIDLVQHNDKICNKIIAEIRKSIFMVADFTEQRQNVYFEAGFAMGLGEDVIRLCKKGEENKLSFDVRQYNYILWESEIDLYENLLDRIQESIHYK